MSKGIQKVEIYRFQLELIVEALRITSNVNKSANHETCHDRQVDQAEHYAINALNGEIDKPVRYMQRKPRPNVKPVNP